MEIYIATLVLNYDYKDKDKFNLQFEFQKDMYDDWIYNKDRIEFYRYSGLSSSIYPASSRVNCNHSLHIAKVEQAFDHSLTIVEQSTLKEVMRKVLLKALNKKKIDTLKSLDRQLDFLKNGEIKNSVIL